MRDLTRLFFASDIHASTLCFKKFLNAWKFYDANVLIIGGDVTGKALVSLVKRGAGGYLAHFMGEESVLRTEDEVAEYETWVEGLGSYTLRCTPEEHAALSANYALRNQRFREAMEDRMAKWVELADQRLEGQSLRVFFNPGNDDIFTIDAIIDRSKRMTRPEGRVLPIDEYLTMISCGFANLTPFRCPRDISEDELRRRVDEMVKDVPDLSRCIFNLHCPPHGTALDQAPMLDENLRPRRSGLGTDVVPPDRSPFAKRSKSTNPCSAFTVTCTSPKVWPASVGRCASTPVPSTTRESCAG
jgi:uncharacterized protein